MVKTDSKMEKYQIMDLGNDQHDHGTEVGLNEVLEEDILPSFDDEKEFRKLHYDFHSGTVKFHPPPNMAVYEEEREYDNDDEKINFSHSNGFENNNNNNNTHIPKKKMPECLKLQEIIKLSPNKLNTFENEESQDSYMLSKAYENIRIINEKSGGTYCEFNNNDGIMENSYLLDSNTQGVSEINDWQIVNRDDTYGRENLKYCKSALHRMPHSSKFMGYVDGDGFCYVTGNGNGFKNWIHPGYKLGEFVVTYGPCRHCFSGPWFEEDSMFIRPTCCYCPKYVLENGFNPHESSWFKEVDHSVIGNIPMAELSLEDNSETKSQTANPDTFFGPEHRLRSDWNRNTRYNNESRYENRLEARRIPEINAPISQQREFYHFLLHSRFPPTRTENLALDFQNINPITTEINNCENALKFNHPIKENNTFNFEELLGSGYNRNGGFYRNEGFILIDFANKENGFPLLSLAMSVVDNSLQQIIEERRNDMAERGEPRRAERQQQQQQIGEIKMNQQQYGSSVGVQGNSHQGFEGASNNEIFQMQNSRLTQGDHTGRNDCQMIRYGTEHNNNNSNNTMENGTFVVNGQNNTEINEENDLGNQQQLKRYIDSLHDMRTNLVHKYGSLFMMSTWTCQDELSRVLMHEVDDEVLMALLKWVIDTEEIPVFFSTEYFPKVHVMCQIVQEELRYRQKKKNFVF